MDSNFTETSGNDSERSGSTGTAPSGNDINALRDDVSRLRTDMGEIVQSILQMTRSGAASAAGAFLNPLRSGAGTVADGVGSAAGSMRDTGLDAIDALNMKVEERPMLALITAFGVGLIVGRVLVGK